MIDGHEWEDDGLPSLRNERLTEDVKDEVVRRYHDRVPTNAIARDLDLPRSTIYWVLKQRGVEPDRGTPPSGVRLPSLGASTEGSVQELSNRLTDMVLMARDVLVELGRVTGRLEALERRLDNLDRRD